jgi:hypothetical protein
MLGMAVYVRKAAYFTHVAKRVRRMRTTLNIDDEVLRAAKERAKREGKHVGEVISDLAKHALTAASGAESGAEHEALYGFRPFSRGDATVTNETIDRLRSGGAY